jgi:uncharacterized phage protein gp47/JayE
MAGLKSTGFETKRLDEIKVELEEDFKLSYGDDTDVDADSVNGQLIANMSKPLAEVWEGLQAIYASQDPNQSSDISLDRTSQLTAGTRLEATATKVDETFFGDEGTVIDGNTFIGKQKNTNELFRPEADSTNTISKTSCVNSLYSINSVQDNHLYTITINGVGHDYTSDADATDLEIMAGLKVSIDAGVQPVTVTDNLDGTLTVDADDLVTSYSTEVSTELDIDEIGISIELFADNEGELSVPSNTLDIIDTPVTGLNSINNNIAGVTGRETETDAEFRQRRRESTTTAGGGTDEAIRTRILQDVDSVSACTVISNRTLATVDGRPPKSFEAIVTGGDDDEVALKIWNTQPSGIESYGNTTVIVKDSQGNNQTIKFSRPTDKYIHLDIEIEINSEEDFPVNGVNDIKDALVTYGNSLGAGDDVFQKKLYTPIYTVPGVGNIPKLELAKTDTPGGTPVFSENDIPIAENEESRFAVDRIQVVII